MSATLNLGTDGNWATKKNSLLAYNSENNNYKPLPFDFSRGSSATVINKDGLIETVGSGEPRIDYKDNTKGALLLEPSRTNLFTYSNDFTNSDWSKQAVAISPNSIIGLDGALSASVLARSTGVLQSLRMNMSLVVGNSYTISCWAKADFDRYITLGFTYSAGNYAGTQFDLQNGTILRTASSGTGYDATNPNIEEFDNGWYRVSVTLQTGVADSYPCFIGSNTIWNSGWFNINEVGDGVNGLYLYGAQLESGYATSYIPTQGGVVTRLAESCSQTPPDGVIGQTELTLFYKGLVERLGGNDGHAIALSQSADALGSSRILLYRNSSNGNMYVYVQDSTTQFSTPLLVNSNPQINDKYAIAIKNNDLVVYCNGVKVSENNSGTLPSTQYLILNKWNNQINEQNKINQVKLYNTRLSNSELQALTSN